MPWSEGEYGAHLFGGIALNSWNSGGFGEGGFGSSNGDPNAVNVVVTLEGRGIQILSGVISPTAGATVSLFGTATPTFLGSALASASATAFFASSQESIFLPTGSVSPFGDANAELSGNSVVVIAGIPSALGNATARPTGSGFQSYVGYAGPELILTISAREFAELFWQDPRALTLSKYLVGGGGGIPSSTGDNRKLIDLILSHPKALTSAKLLALGD